MSVSESDAESKVNELMVKDAESRAKVLLDGEHRQMEGTNQNGSKSKYWPLYVDGTMGPTMGGIPTVDKKGKTLSLRDHCRRQRVTASIMHDVLYDETKSNSEEISELQRSFQRLLMAEALKLNDILFLNDPQTASKKGYDAKHC